MEKGKKRWTIVCGRSRETLKEKEREQKVFIKQKKDQKQQILKMNPYNPQEVVCGCCQDISVQLFLFFPALCH